VKAHRNPLLLFAIFFFIVGVQFILIGLVAELIVRAYHETRNKPTYILKERFSEPDWDRQLDFSTRRWGE
jgi:hypothetical protein